MEQRGGRPLGLSGEGAEYISPEDISPIYLQMEWEEGRNFGVRGTH